MSRPWVVLILFFQPVLSISDFERFLIRERWLPTSEENEIFKTKTIAGVSPECQTDYTRWMTDLAVFAKDFNECFIQQSPKCNNETKAELKKNIYALKQLDAFGRLPPGVLDIDLTQSGSETECKEVSKHYYKTHYCFVSSAFGKNASCDSATGTTVTTKRAVCMPASCSEQDILLIWNNTHHLMPFTHCGVECVPETGHTNTFFWIFVIFLAILVGLCVFASVVDFVRDSYLNRQAKEAEHLCLRLLLVFSFYTNGHAILDTTPAREGHLKSLDCIRFFSMVWVVTGHVSTLWLHSDTLQPAFHLMKPIAADIIGSAVFSVDTFFVLSGMLVSYMFFKQMFKKPQLIKNPATWILFYVHRYLRLTPPYMLFIGFYIAFTPLIVGQNAMLFGNAEEVDLCVKYWWRNLIYINNFEPEDTCYGISWYLSADTQMYLAAPVFLVALFISHWVGLAVIISAISGSVGLTFYWIFHDDLAANLIRAGAKTEDFHIKLYLAPWIRITPYLVGMYVGYLLVNFPKTKRPRLHVLLPIIGWICTIGIALACVFGPYKYLAFETNWSKFTSAFYYSFSRIGWGFFICWTVAANFYGWGGPIAAFMDHPLWQPLGRLSYTAYLVHYFVITYFINLFDRPLHFTSFLAQFQTFTIPITIMAYCFAFVWSCTCELPFLKLEKMAVDGLMGSRGPRVKPEEKIVESWEDEKPKQEIEEILEKF